MILSIKSYYINIITYTKQYLYRMILSIKPYLNNIIAFVKSYLNNMIISYKSYCINIVSPVKPYQYGRIIIPVITAIFIITLYKTPLASWNAGLPGAVFRMPAGAFATGAGGAVSADPEYMLSWYNPSKLPLLRDRRAALGAGIRSLGRAEGWASYDFRVPPRVGMGLSLVYRGDPFVNNLYDGYYEGGEVVEERELKGAAWTAASVKIGAGYLASRKLSLGGSVAVNYQSLPTAPDDDGNIHNTTITSIGAFDIAASYKLTPNLTLSASVRNLLSRSSWQIETGDFAYGGAPVDEVVPPVFVLASSHKTALLERELIWGADAAIYLIDGEGKYLGHAEAALAAGARWKFTDALTLMAGLADVELSDDMGGGYWDGFSPRVALGFSYSLTKWTRGAVFNYAIATDRVWAGIDQQFDITVSF